MTAHIPPGVHTPNGLVWMYEKFNTKLVEILQRYASIIVGLHFGHDHADGFKILPDSHGNVRNQTELYCFTFDGVASFFFILSIASMATYYWRFKKIAQTFLKQEKSLLFSILVFKSMSNCIFHAVVEPEKSFITTRPDL